MLSKTKMAERVEQLTGDKPPEPEWLTCHQAALFCNVSLGTFRKHIMKEVTCKRLGWRIMVQRKSLEKYFQGLDDPSHHPRAKRKKSRRQG